MSILLIKISLCIISGLAAGLSAVYVFNHIPWKWLCDYNETPVERGNHVAACRGTASRSNAAGRSGVFRDDCLAESITRSLVDPEFRRLRENLWRWVYSAGFICLCLRLSLTELQSGLLTVDPDFAMYSGQMAVAGLVACWFMLIIALADMKYMIIPDQFVIMLALAGVGFAPVTGFREALVGLAIGGGFMLACALAGKLIFRQEAFGFGDVKLCAAMGLVLGINGIIASVAAAIILSGSAAAAGLVTGRCVKSDRKPLGPYLCGCGMAYIFIVMPFLGTG